MIKQRAYDISKTNVALIGTSLSRTLSHSRRELFGLVLVYYRKSPKLSPGARIEG
jgi:hypothetical protein